MNLNDIDKTIRGFFGPEMANVLITTKGTNYVQLLCNSNIPTFEPGKNVRTVKLFEVETKLISDPDYFYDPYHQVAPPRIRKTFPSYFAFELGDRSYKQYPFQNEPQLLALLQKYYPYATTLENLITETELKAKEAKKQHTLDSIVIYQSELYVFMQQIIKNTNAKSDVDVGLLDKSVFFRAVATKLLNYVDSIPFPSPKAP